MVISINTIRKERENHEFAHFYGRTMLVLFAAVIVVGNVADIFMGFMAIINLVAILLLGKWALRALDDYSEQRRRGVDPVFVSSRIEGMPKTECWHQTEVEHVGPNPVKEYLDESLDADTAGLK